MPISEQIGKLSEKAESVAADFFAQSIELRLGYEYKSRFLNKSDKSNLYEIAWQASDELEEIKVGQDDLRQKIESYDGSDWDRLFGETGFWRKISFDVHRTELLRAQIDYYLAISAEGMKRQKILYKINKSLDGLEKSTESNAVIELLRAKVFGLLAQTDFSFKASAENQLELVLTSPEVSERIKILVEIEKIKSYGPKDRKQLQNLFEQLRQGGCEDDFELNTSLAFLQLRLGIDEGLKKVIAKWPDSKGFFAELILSDLHQQLQDCVGDQCELYLRSLSSFQAKLAAVAALKGECSNYAKTFLRLVDNKKFHNSLLLYTAAVANEDTNIQVAVDLFIKASKCVEESRHNLLYDETEMKLAAASGAFDLVTGLFAKHANYCQLTLEALENYRQISAGRMDEQYEYLYAVVLAQSGQRAKSVYILEKLADSNGAFAKRAKQDLLVYQAKKLSQCQNPVRAVHHLLAGSDQGHCPDIPLAIEIFLQILETIEKYQFDSTNFDRLLGDYYFLLAVIHFSPKLHP